VVFDEGRRLADQVIEALKSKPAVSVGVNQPYSPADRVYYTLARHGNRQGLPAVMIEIRNDEICDVEGQRKWAGKLADLFNANAPSVSDAGVCGGVDDLCKRPNGTRTERNGAERRAERMMSGNHSGSSRGNGQMRPARGRASAERYDA
jgi:N-formylglutamate amidohydrolase